MRALDELWRRGIVREQGTDAYDFAHGQIRDVAYDALSPAARRRNHRLIAAALLALHERDVESVTGEIGRHFDGAGQVRDAVTWYRRAAVQAQQLYANVEAVHLLDRASELLGTLPDGPVRRDGELEVLSALPTPLAVTDGFLSTRLVQTQRRLLELGRDAGVEPKPSLLRSLAMTKLCRDDFDGARAVATQLRSLAERDGDELLLVETEYLLGIGAFWAGAFETARQHFERVGRECDPGRRTEHVLRFGHDPEVVCLSRLANTLLFLGHPDEARRARDEAMTLAHEVGHPFSRGVPHVFAALLAVDLDEPAPYRGYVDAMLDAQHQPLQIAADVFVGYADVLEGRATDGIERIRAAIGTQPVNHAPGQHACHLRMLVGAYDLAGDVEDGLSSADEALRSGGTRIWEAEHRRLRAGFVGARGAPAAEVEAELARATDVARHQGAVGLERRVERALIDRRGRR